MTPARDLSPARAFVLAVLLMVAALVACGDNDDPGDAGADAARRLEERFELQPRIALTATPAPQEAGTVTPTAEPADPTPEPQDTVALDEYLAVACAPV